MAKREVVVDATIRLFTATISHVMRGGCVYGFIIGLPQDTLLARQNCRDKELLTRGTHSVKKATLAGTNRKQKMARMLK